MVDDVPKGLISKNFQNFFPHKRVPVSPPLPAEMSGPSFKWNVLIGIHREKSGSIELWKLLMEHGSQSGGKPWSWLFSLSHMGKPPCAKNAVFTMDNLFRQIN